MDGYTHTERMALLPSEDPTLDIDAQYALADSPFEN